MMQNAMPMSYDFHDGSQLQSFGEGGGERMMSKMAKTSSNV